MKKLSELMKEMGFNPQAPDSAKEAFLKYLIKQGLGVHVQTPTEKCIVAANPKKILQFPQQMTFDFDDTESQNQTKKKSNHNA